MFARNFNPRSPYGERLTVSTVSATHDEFQSTLPLRGATGRRPGGLDQGVISIHAPLTGSDNHPAPAKPDAEDFNPRSPYGERRWRDFTCGQSVDFNPRSPYGERLACRPSACSHVPFQSTLPLRGATSQCPSGFLLFHFNPRSPYGERQPLQFSDCLEELFQSTLPLRGATNFFNADKVDYLFQSTLPLRGATSAQLHGGIWSRFQSTLPLRGATQGASGYDPGSRFQSTLPLRGATWEINQAKTLT